MPPGAMSLQTHKKMSFTRAVDALRKKGGQNVQDPNRSDSEVRNIASEMSPFVGVRHARYYLCFKICMTYCL